MWLVSIDLLTHVYEHSVHMNPLKSSWALNQWNVMWCLSVVANGHKVQTKPEHSSCIKCWRKCFQSVNFVFAIKSHLLHGFGLETLCLFFPLLCVNSLLESSSSSSSMYPFKLSSFSTYEFFVNVQWAITWSTYSVLKI